MNAEQTPMEHHATIRSLFDPARAIDRTIEKVITYDVSQAARLKTEISEYIVTESIETQLLKLLEAISAAIDGGDVENAEVLIEIAVWLSGFYGSGKSSFRPTIWPRHSTISSSTAIGTRRSASASVWVRRSRDATRKASKRPSVPS